MTGPGAGAVCPQGHASDDPDWCDVCGLAVAPSGPGGAPGGPGPADPGTRWSTPTGAVAAGTPSSGAAATGGSGGAVCAACAADLAGRFCEECGHDSLAPVRPVPLARGVDATLGVVAVTPLDPPTAGASGGRSAPVAPGDPSAPVAPGDPASAGRWRAVVRADRAWFEEVRRRDGVDAAALEFPRYVQERRFALSGPQVAIGRRSAARGTEPEVDLTGLDPAVSAAHALLVARPDGGWDLVDVGSTNGTTLAVEDGPIPPHRPVPLADGAVIHLGAWTTVTLTADPG